MSYDIRLRAYSPGTDTLLGVLPETLSWDASVVHNNDGALTIKASQLADRGAILARTLNEGLDVALEVNTTGTPTGWAEPDNCHFLLVDRKRDQTDKAKVLELSLVSWSWLLNKICDLNTGALQGSKSKYAGQRMFPATSDAGDVMKKGLDEHDARSGPAVPIIRDSWTTTLDSNGVAWTKKLGKNGEGRAFPAGQPLHARLDALTTNGLCDWRTRGRGLRIYNPGTAGTDRSATVHLRYGDDLSDAPSQTSQADRVARILVKGDGKHKATEYDPTVPEHYGRWEAMIDSAGVKDDDDLEDAGKAALADRNRIKGEYTRTLTMAGKYLPFRDYNVGDYITAPGDSGDEVLKVMQITISRNEQMGLSGNIVLGDRFTSKDLALAGKVNAITGGSSGTSGNGTSGQSAPEDTRQAAAPADFTASGSLVLGADHRWSVNLTASWSAVTTATDGTALDVSGYKLMAQPSGGQWRELARTAATSLVLPGFVQGSAWTFAVVAIPDTAKWESPWSTQVPVTFPADTTAPNKTSAPHLESASSIVTASWDGLDHLGAAMAQDLRNVEVLADTSNPPSTVVGNLSAAGTWTGYADAGDTVYVALRAWDYDDNDSPLSAVASIVVKSVLDDAELADLLALKATTYVQDTVPVDAPPGSWWWTESAPLKLSYTEDGTTWVTRQVDAAQFLAAGTIVTELLAAGAVQADKIASDSILARHIRTGEVTADKIGTGLLKAQITLSGIIRTAETGKRVVMDATGITLYAADNTVITFINTDGESSFKGNVTAVGLSVIGAMTLTSADNVMGPGSVLTLGAGVQQPGTAPNVSAFWPQLQLKNAAAASIGTRQVSRLADGTWLSRAYDSKTWDATYDKHNSSSGAYVSTATPSSQGFSYGLEALTVIGDYAYSVTATGEDGSGNEYLSFSKTNLFTGVTKFAGDWTNNFKRPAGAYTVLGTDGTVLLLAFDSTVRVFSLVHTGDAFTATYVKSFTSAGTSIEAVTRGTFDLGVDLVAVATNGGVRTYRYSDGVENTDGSFPLPSAAVDCYGLGYYGGSFWAYLDRVYYFDGVKWAGASSTKAYDFAYSYQDTTHSRESKPSARQTINAPRRARLKVSVPGWVADTSGVDGAINALRFYGGASLGTLYAQGNNAAGFLDLAAIANASTVPTPSQPPTSTSFPTATPAKITSSDGSALVLSGDGSLTAASVSSTAMPTVGATPLIKSGSDANGSWTRLADGTAFARSIVQNIASNGSKTWTFPAGVGFNVEPMVFCTAKSASSAVTGVTSSGTTTTSSVIGVNRTNTTSTDVYVFALGTWK